MDEIVIVYICLTTAQVQALVIPVQPRRENETADGSG